MLEVGTLDIVLFISNYAIHNRYFDIHIAISVFRSRQFMITFKHVFQP